ncbi:type II toxin-antitoxin system HicA family toxin [Xanthocytophaga flava]|uniref:type II toxin-antitoxin system HicA family toxin n=1 Tax=Xanthocytophaga flava TaxID=3048013 RepID=UPI0028D42A38|nr:type II toxin-antitoxin system HicA family toxin [Xanthocytophaga flavus]MDJ1468166.1 type II toxin-antitoxin system HicA family toxin [Xanthocytophaga flavus]
MTANDLIRRLEANGWYFVRQSGSHKMYKHNERTNTISVPDHGKKDLGPGLVNSILKQAGLK